MVTTTSGAVTSRERKDESANHALAISPKTEEACRKIFEAVRAKYEATAPRVLFSILNWSATSTNRTVVLDANGSLFFRPDDGMYYAFSRFPGHLDNVVVPVGAKIEVPVTTLSAAGYAGCRGDMRIQQEHFLAYNGPIDTAFENAIGYAETIGRRGEMEDTMAIKRLNERYLFFGVFDGHAGREVADKVARELANKVAAHFGTRDLTDAELNQVWGEMDKACEEGAGGSGSTATVALLDRQNDELCMVNLGDARMVLAGADGAVLAKTTDHKPSDSAENTRIQAEQGQVYSGRVGGVLAVSRAFGDFSLKPFKDFKNQAEGRWYQVGIEPTITRCKLPAKGYLILACDGLWDVITSEDAATFTARAGAEGMSPEEIATELLSAAYTGNITESNRTRGLKITPTVQTPFGFQQTSSDNISVQVIDIAKLREAGVLRPVSEGASAGAGIGS